VPEQADTGATIEEAATEEEFGAFDDAIASDVRDPYPEFARVRRETPVQLLEFSSMPHEEAAKIFCVYRYEDVAQILRDGETFSSEQIVDLVMGPVMGQHIILGMDGERHRRYRALVSSAFKRKGLARWEAELVENTANGLIDRFAEHGSAELVNQFTFPYPTQIIAGLLGLPREDHKQFQKWSIGILGFLSDQEKGIAAAREVTEYVSVILEQRRREPREDILSGLAHAELDGEQLSDEEIFSFVRLLLPAGVETTYRSTGNLLFLLMSHPEQLEAVRADRGLVPQAIEEAIRFEIPLTLINRIAKTDTEIGGVAVPAGSTVMVMLGAANRDESRYPDPDRFDIFRTDPRPHISFGLGPHSCLGLNLARMEMRVALNLLLDRLPNLRLDPAADDPHIRGQAFRSPTALPVLFG
jgi:cytochrome P450